MLCAKRDTMPAVGGIGVDDATLLRYPYLPEYVVLHEPSREDIWASPKMRSIFLNQPLEAWENAAVERLRSLLKKDMDIDDKDELPRWILPHLSRILQQCKYKPEHALTIWPQLFEERGSKLPIEFNDVREVLAHGFVYFHGRDRRCRPLLTIRVGRSGPLWGSPELVKLVFIYSMEFALRYLLVPGRVENWSVLIDCTGVENLPNFWKGKDLAQAIATALGKVYSGRMAWMRIVNFPKGLGYRAIKMFVEKIISAMGKSDKVSILSGCSGADLCDKVELGQLEASLGGTAPDLAPQDTFPFRMFSSPVGFEAATSSRVRTASDFSTSGGPPCSMHMITDLAFHEGMILAECLDGSTDWKFKVRQLPLPKSVATHFDVEPVKNVTEWCERMSQLADARRDSDVSILSDISTGAVDRAKSNTESSMLNDEGGHIPGENGQKTPAKSMSDIPEDDTSAQPTPCCPGENVQARTISARTLSWPEVAAHADAEPDAFPSVQKQDANPTLPVSSHPDSREETAGSEHGVEMRPCLCNWTCFPS